MSGVWLGDARVKRPPNVKLVPLARDEINRVVVAAVVQSGKAENNVVMGGRIGRSNVRQRWLSYGRARVLCTYHPSYLLRNPAAKKPVWDDMKFLLTEMGLQPPA